MELLKILVSALRIKSKQVFQICIEQKETWKGLRALKNEQWHDKLFLWWISRLLFKNFLLELLQETWGPHCKEHTFFNLKARSMGYLFCQSNLHLAPGLIPSWTHFIQVGKTQQEWNLGRWLDTLSTSPVKPTPCWQFLLWKLKVNNSYASFFTYWLWSDQQLWGFFHLLVMKWPTTLNLLINNISDMFEASIVLEHE